LHCAFSSICNRVGLPQTPIQISQIRRCCLMVTMNQLYLVKGGPGIIALHSLLYLQSCRVTVFGISLCRISLTNLPLLLHVWYKSHQFSAVAVHRCHFSRLGVGCALTFPSEAKFEIEAKILLRLEAKKKPDFT
jgi:hypothetical protein